MDYFSLLFSHSTSLEVTSNPTWWSLLQFPNASHVGTRQLRHSRPAQYIHNSSHSWCWSTNHCSLQHLPFAQKFRSLQCRKFKISAALLHPPVRDNSECNFSFVPALENYPIQYLQNESELCSRCPHFPSPQTPRMRSTITRSTCDARGFSDKSQRLAMFFDQCPFVCRSSPYASLLLSYWRLSTTLDPSFLTGTPNVTAA